MLERLYLVVSGWLAGMHRIMRACPDGTWSSPFLRREEDALKEYSSKVWGIEQARMKKYHAEARRLLADIAKEEHKKKELEALRASYDENFFCSAALYSAMPDSYSFFPALKAFNSLL